jgi:hypothetical protein
MNIEKIYKLYLKSCKNGIVVKHITNRAANLGPLISNLIHNAPGLL